MAEKATFKKLHELIGMNVNLQALLAHVEDILIDFNFNTLLDCRDIIKAWDDPDECIKADAVKAVRMINEFCKYYGIEELFDGDIDSLKDIREFSKMLVCEILDESMKLDKES